VSEKKSKPKWVTTTLKWDIKVSHYWKAMVGTTTHVTWQQALSNMKWTAKDEKYHRDSLHTYNELINEILKMPESQIEQLPNDIRDWASQLRQNKTENTEETNKEAMNEHQTQILRLMKDCQSYILFRLSTFDPIKSLDSYYVEQNEMFARMLQHCPTVNEKYSFLNELKKGRKRSHYFDNQQHILLMVHGSISNKEGGASLNFQWSEFDTDEEYELYHMLIARLVGNSVDYLLNIENPYRLPRKGNMIADVYKEIISEGLTKYLDANAIDMHKQFLDEFAKDAVIRESREKALIYLKEVFQAEVALKNSIDISITSNEHKHYSCDWCP